MIIPRYLKLFKVIGAVDMESDFVFAGDGRKLLKCSMSHSNSWW